MTDETPAGPAPAGRCHPPGIQRASWRNVLPPDEQGDVCLAFDWAGGAGAVRLRLSAEHARALLGALAAYLRPVCRASQSPNSLGS